MSGVAIHGGRSPVQPSMIFLHHGRSPPTDNSGRAGFGWLRAAFSPLARTSTRNGFAESVRQYDPLPPDQPGRNASGPRPRLMASSTVSLNFGVGAFSFLISSVAFGELVRPRLQLACAPPPPPTFFFPAFLHYG